MQVTYNFAVKPLMRWAGCKYYSCIPDMIFNIYQPFAIEDYVYCSRFAGALGDVLSVQPERALISDNDHLLVSLYKWIQEGGEWNIQVPLEDITKKDYNAARLRFRFLKLKFDMNWYKPTMKGLTEDQLAELFTLLIWLMKTGFNGVYRVNAAGEYNIPYGEKTEAKMPNLLKFKQAIKNFEFVCCDFSETIAKTEKYKGERFFIYDDPPYDKSDPLYENEFTMEDQKRLAKCDVNSPRVASNLFTPEMVSLYSQRGFEIIPIDVNRSVNVHAGRVVTELFAVKIKGF